MYCNHGLDGHLGVESSSQGAQGDITLNHISKEVHSDTRLWLESEEAWDTIFRGMTTREEGSFEWLVEDELRGQRVLAALAQELRNEHAIFINHRWHPLL